jgi:hypothetical protein
VPPPLEPVEGVIVPTVGAGSSEETENLYRAVSPAPRVSEKIRFPPLRDTATAVFETSSWAVTVAVEPMPNPFPSTVSWTEEVVEPVFWAVM